MTPKNEFLETLTDQLGADAVAKLCAIYGGRQIYVPEAPSKTQTPTVHMPAFRISGAFRAQTPLGSAVAITGIAATYMHQNVDVDGLVVEIEPQGVGQAYLARLAEALAPLGIQVKPLL